MGKRNRKKKREEREAIAVRSRSACVLSEETNIRLLEFQKSITNPGAYHIAIVHEWPCANAQRAGAIKCTCQPEIKLIDGVTKDGRMLDRSRN